MKKIRKIWNDIKAQPDIWFFYGFLATFTLSVRKVLLFYPKARVFNEYTGIYLYLSDLFLMLTLVLWILSYLYNKKLNLSICIHKLSTLINRHNLLITLPAALILWSFISISWSGNWQVSLFRSVKLLEFYLLYIYAIFRIVPPQYTKECSIPVRQKMFHVEQFTSLRDGTFLEHGASARLSTRQVEQFQTTRRIWSNIIKIIIFTGLIQSIIGIWQFITQKSIGLFWLKESLISPSIDGVAKILIGGEKYIRAYGLFPHPNILGGFLLVTIILSLFYRRLFHFSTTENVPSQNNKKCSTPAQNNLFHVEQIVYAGHAWNKSNLGRCRAFEYLLPIFVLIQIIALFLSFSKSAWIGLFLALVYIYLKIIAGCSTDIQKGNVPPTHYRICSIPVTRKCSTWNISGATGHAWNKFRVRGKRGTILVAGIVIIVLALFVPKINFSDFLVKSMNERILYLDDSVSVIKSSPIAGIGSGQFVLEMQKYSQIQLEYWQFQPVHNVFLLIWSELGIIGLFIFLWFIWKLFRACPERLNCSTQKRNNLFHPEKDQNVPRVSRGNKLFHVEQFISLRDGTFSDYGASVEHSDLSGHAWNNLILYGMEQLIIFRGILLGLILIMLFDHYLWDIQQGQIIFWLLAGILVNMSSSEKTSIES